MATITMRNPTEQVTINLVTEDCCHCGVTFAMPVSFNKQRREDGDWFFCPAGHKQHYTETEAEIERKKREQAERRLASEQEWSRRMQNDLAAERKSHATTKGQLTKTRKRVQGGVCPIDGCHRHFVNLERHMATKHPEAA